MKNCTKNFLAKNFLVLSSVLFLANGVLAAPVAPTTQAKSAKKPAKDPVVIFLNGKYIKLSQIMPYLVSLTGGNFNGLSQQQLISAIDMARKMYVMQIMLENEATKKNYESDQKYKEQYEKARKSTSVSIYMQELGKTFSESQIKEAYNKYVESNNLSDFSFRLIIVQEEKIANLIKASLSNGVDFGKLAKEKSLHGSADRENNPGLIDFVREDYITRAFGAGFVKELRGMRTNEVRSIKLPDGKTAIIKFVNKRKAKALDLSEVKAKLIGDMTNAKLIEMTDKFLESDTIAFYSLDGKKETVTKMMPKKKPAGNMPKKVSAAKG